MSIEYSEDVLTAINLDQDLHEEEEEVLLLTRMYQIVLTRLDSIRFDYIVYHSLLSS